MANCLNCNAPNEGNAIFCSACGALMTGVYQTAVVGEPEAVKRIRKIGSSKLMLALAILESALLAFSFIGTLFTASLSSRAVISSAISVISGSVLSILVCVGLWLMYSASKKPEGIPISTTGLTIIRTVKIIELVFISISLLIFLVATVFFIFFLVNSGNYSGDIDIGLGKDITEFIMGLVTGILVGVIFSLAVAIIYFAISIRFLSGVRETAKMGYPVSKSALPLAVFSFISGGFGLIVSILTPLMLNMALNSLQTYKTNIIDVLSQVDGGEIIYDSIIKALPTYTVFVTVSGICSSVVAIIIGVLALKYRSAIKNMR